MKRRSQLTALSLVLLVAAPAIAGGISLKLTVDESRLAPDSRGVVTVSGTLSRGSIDCGGTGYIACDPKLTGPEVSLERRGDDEQWVAVEAPWTGPGGYERDFKTPYRLDWNDRLGFSREGKLEPGTYRLHMSVTVSHVDYTFAAVSEPFEVVGKSQKSWLGKLFD